MLVSRLTRCGSLLLISGVGALAASLGAAGCNFQEGVGDANVAGSTGTGGSKNDPSSTGTAGGGAAGLTGETALGAQAVLAPDVCGDGQDSQVARVPDNGRTIDSALYGLRVLRRGLKPEPSKIRVGDFTNYYALPLVEGVDEASIDFRIETGPNDVAHAGTLIARLPTPAKVPFQPRLVVAIDTSVSMLPLVPTQIAVAEALEASSSALGGTAEIRTWTTPTFDPSGNYAIDAVNDAASVVRDVCATPGSDAASGQITHVVLLGDGRASLDKMGSALVECPNIRVDAIVVAHATESNVTAADGKELEDVATGYRAESLDLVSQFGGASLLVTDEQDASGYVDVRMLDERFPVLFGDAFESVRVMFTFPSVLTPLSVVPDTLPLSAEVASLPLVARTVGYGDGVTFRQLMQVTDVIDPMSCGVAQVSATIYFKRLSAQGTGDFEMVTTSYPLIEVGGGGVNPTRDYDDAVSTFAQTLRTGEAAAAFERISAAFSSRGCGQIQSVACTNLEEMKQLLQIYKPAPNP